MTHGLKDTELRYLFPLQLQQNIANGSFKIGLYIASPKWMLSNCPMEICTRYTPELDLMYAIELQYNI